MEIASFLRMLPTRACRFGLSLQGGVVFADFDLDDDGLIFHRRISFDGFGCCHVPESVRRMNDAHSRALDEPTVENALRTYFCKNKNLIWEDALVSRELL